MKVSNLDELASVRAYLLRIGAEPRGLRSAVVKTSSGRYWRDLAVIRFSTNGEVDTTDHYLPTEEEAAAIAAEFETVDWPKHLATNDLTDLPQQVRDAADKDVFFFRNSSGAVVMIQVRIETAEGRRYFPFTFWDDGLWRAAEPEGKLPLYNAERLTGAARVFIHEGAKAARRVQELCDALTTQTQKSAAAHPWIQELRTGVHVGWIGGALSPQRTDWGPVNRSGATTVYIVADNDQPGYQAIPKIAHDIRTRTMAVEFGGDFPPSFDLADPFPEKFFIETTEGAQYIGPSFASLVFDATWATDLVDTGNGRMNAVLRPHFIGAWAYIDETDLFVCMTNPLIQRDQDRLDKRLSAFSHASRTSKLILKAYEGMRMRMAYRPDRAGEQIISDGEVPAVNLYRGSSIRPRKGDLEPWFSFLEYMFVDDKERRQMERWLATLIARPDVRMAYGVLLVSEKQGIGKNTLGSSVLVPLLGQHNCTFPSESTIVGSFTEWVAQKRFALVSEIYSGHSWKAYHMLKGIITDKEIIVNGKYQRPYTLDNWVHVLACSNSLRALKMEADDRRWFYPQLNETPWPGERFKRFRYWLSAGGLATIAHWANEYGDFVGPGDRAPMTLSKAELIDGSRTEAQKEAFALAIALRETEQPVALTIKDVVLWLRTNSQTRVFESDYEIRKVLVEGGMVALPERIKIGQRLHYILLNESANANLPAGKIERNQYVRKVLTSPGSVMNEAEI